jgi:hypothetical protein
MLVAEHNHEDLSGTAAVAGIKMAIGAIIGKTMDDSIEGKVKI